MKALIVVTIVMTSIALLMILLWVSARKEKLREIERVTGKRVQTTSADALRSLERQYEQQRQFECDQVNWP